MGYIIDLEVYQGPFDLLLGLIDKQEIDIWDIPIAQITREFLDYIHTLRERKLAISGDFIVMAATLLEIKAKMLLPSTPVDEEDEESLIDPRERLVEQLLQYKFFKEVAGLLQERGAQAANVYLRGFEHSSINSRPVFLEPIGEIGVHELAKLFFAMLDDIEKSEKQVHAINRRITLYEKIRDVRLKLLENKELNFESLFDERTRYSVVICFLAVLELIRTGEIKVKQYGHFGGIFITANEVDKEGVS